MAESEIYRVEIPIIINDQTEQPLERARERINRFQREAEKTNSRLQRMAARIYRFRMMVHDRVTPTLQKIQKTLPNLVKKTWTITLKAKDKVTDVVKRIIGFVTSPLTLLGAGAGLTAAIGFPLNVAGEMDRARRSIELFSGSAEAGRRNFEELVNLAIKSPIYEVPFVVKEAGQLLAKGMNIDFVKRALNAFGNAAMYTGASLEQLELAFYGFGQIASVGTLSMEELRQVTENLNVPLNWITQELGITGDKLKELGKLGIPAKRAMEAIVRTLEKRFPVKNFNNDLFALIANIKEAGRTIVWRFGKGMLQPVIRILQDLSGSLDPASEKFKQFQQKVEDFGRRVGQKFEQMYQRIKRIFGDISNTPGFNDMSWSEKISLALDKILEAVTGWLEGPGGETMSKTGKILGTLLAAGLRGAIPNFVPLGWELAKALAKGIWEGVTSDPLLTTIFGAYLGFKIGGPWGALIGGGGGLLFSLLRRATNQITEGTTNSLPPQNKVFYNEAIKRASGGIFSRPHLALVAEAGPEAIIPLSERMRFRALDLWMQVGRMLGVNQYYVQTGRMIGTRQYNEGGYASRLPVAAPITLGFKPAAVTTGPVNVTFNVYASDGQNVLQVIRANYKVIADEVAWVIANALPSTFQNMPNS